MPHRFTQIVVWMNSAYTSDTLPTGGRILFLRCTNFATESYPQHIHRREPLESDAPAAACCAQIHRRLFSVQKRPSDMTGGFVAQARSVSHASIIAQAVSQFADRKFSIELQQGHQNDN
jgi:hypothetical protein